MSRIGSSGTKPEIAVRKIVRKIIGARYRVNLRGIPGTPDVAIPSLRIAIMVNGCFWHGHDCGVKIPKAKKWRDKIAATRARDLRDSKLRASLGWVNVVIWECELNRSHSAVSRKIHAIVKSLMK